MTTFSLCMIVKNEEDCLEHCLNSVCDIVDEIIIVDTGSTDRTKEIAKKFTSAVYDFAWVDDFSAARNYSFSLATMDYIFWLDADDVLLEEDRQKLLRLKEEMDTGIDVVMMKYHWGVDEYGNVVLSYLRERLIKNCSQYRWEGPVHECIAVNGNFMETNICVTHTRMHPAAKGRNLEIFEKVIRDGKTLSPRSMFYFARELYYNGRYDDAIAYYHMFLESGEGWMEDNICACLDMAKAYKSKSDPENSLIALLLSFQYDTPRAEICCEIGAHYMEVADYNRAVFWYELATNLEKPQSIWGFIWHDCWGYLPNIQLSICHYRLGNMEEAVRYNEEAAKYKPDDPSVLSNREFFKNLTDYGWELVNE